MDVWVNGYYRKDGTYVKGYWRTSPDTSISNNYSTIGNTNPYTGAEGTKSGESQLNLSTYLTKPTVKQGSKGFLINPSSTGGTINGSDKIDTVIYQKPSSSYQISKLISGYSVSGTDGTTDVVLEVERLQFSDKTIALDTSGNAGKAYRVYQAAFNRKPDIKGLKYWVDQMDQGLKLSDVASGFSGSSEFIGLYGKSPTAEQLVTNLYENILHRPPDPSGYDYWVGRIRTDGMKTNDIICNFSESPENQAALIGVIEKGIDIGL